MGEYAVVDGHEYKMGTCESLYYVSLPMLNKWRTEGRIQQLRHETAPADWDNGSYRFRFPFPDEDKGITIDQHFDHDRMLVVDVSKYPDLADFDHTDICHSCSAGGFGHTVNVFHPCPQDPKIAAYKTSPITWRVVGISQQKPVGGEVWTVIDCPYCGGKARLPWEDAEKLVACLRAKADSYVKGLPTDNHHMAEYLDLVADRVEAGYTKSK